MASNGTDMHQDKKFYYCSVPWEILMNHQPCKQEHWQPISNLFMLCNGEVTIIYREVLGFQNSWQLDFDQSQDFFPKYLSARKMGESQNHFLYDTSSSITLANFSAHPDQTLVFSSFFTMGSHLTLGLGGSAHKMKIPCNLNYPWKILEFPHRVLCLLSYQLSNVSLGLLINFSIPTLSMSTNLSPPSY